MFLQRGSEQPAFSTYLGRKWTCIESRQGTVTELPLKHKSKGSESYQRLPRRLPSLHLRSSSRNGRTGTCHEVPPTLPLHGGKKPLAQHYDYTIPQTPTPILASKLLNSFIFLPLLKIPPLQRNFVCSPFFISSLSRHNETTYTHTFRQAIYFCFILVLLSGMFTFKQCIKQHYLTTSCIKNAVQLCTVHLAQTLIFNIYDACNSWPKHSMKRAYMP